MNNALPPLQDLDLPTKWPFTNARLRGLVAGFPVKPLDRLANFGADEFERFALEWADGYLSKKLPDVSGIQQRGGAGDKVKTSLFGSASLDLRPLVSADMLPN